MFSQPTQGPSGPNHSGGGWADRTIHQIDEIKRVMIALGTLVFLGIGMQKVLWAELHVSDAEAATHAAATPDAGSNPQATDGPMRDDATQSTQGLKLILVACPAPDEQGRRPCMPIQQWSVGTELGTLVSATIQPKEDGVEVRGKGAPARAPHAAQQPPRPPGRSNNGARATRKRDCK